MLIKSKSVPRVSVVMPIRDVASTVGTSVVSILDQTFRDFEFIVIDDGSEDESANIVAEFAAHDARVILVRRPRLGFVDSLIYGTNLARGEFIARMDADDISVSTRFERQIDMLDRSPDVAVVGSLVEIFSESPIRFGMNRYGQWINSLQTHDEIERELFIESPLAHPSVMLRSEPFKSVGGYRLQPVWPEDYDLWMRLWIAGYRMAKVPEVLLRWQFGPSSLSQTDNRYSQNAFRAMKLHFLRQTYLRDETREIVVWGAGVVGKRWLRDLPKEGISVTRAVDVARRRIGHTIHGAKVVAVADVPPPERAFVLCAVGAPGVRADIRQDLDARGYVECRDYLFVA